MARCACERWVQNAEQQARAIGAATVDAVAKAARWTLVTLLPGAAAALFGGMSGAPRDLVATTARRVV